MRIHRLTSKGLTRYEGFEVDFDALGEGLIAIAGLNGAGKTSILESPCGCIHLELPSYPGNLANSMHGKDAFLEMYFSNGDPYKAHVSVDAINKLSEAYLFAGDGTPLTDGKIGTFKAEIERRFGSKSLFLSACLSSQKKRGAFSALGPAEKKALLTEILDTSNLQVLSEAAAKAVTDSDRKLLGLRGELQAMKTELDGLPATDTAALVARREQIEKTISEVEHDLEHARERYAKAKADLDVAAHQAADRAAKETDLAQVEKDRQETLARLDALKGDRVALKARIEAAIKAQQEEAANLAEYQTSAQKLTELEAELITLRETEPRLTSDLEAARSAYRDAEFIRRQAEQTETQIQATKTQAALLGEVPCGGTGPYAGCKLIGAAKTASDSLPELEASLNLLKPLPSLDEMREKGGLIEGSLRKTRETISATESALGAVTVSAGRLPLAIAAAGRITELEKEATDGDAALVARQHEYEKLDQSIGDRLAKLQAELSATSAGNLAFLNAALNAIAEEGRTKKEALAGLQTSRQDILADITRAEEAEKRRKELTVLLDLKAAMEGDLVKDLGEWQILAKAFGRDGIQALEIDAAGPELSDLTNELLTSCFGERFEVRFITQIPRADGKGNKEVFDIQVLDHERGREDSIDRFSGGEGVILFEAVSLALAIYVGRHSGRRYETLFRDETAGALDPDNAPRYITMLRRARAMASVHQIVFIAQQPELWQSADAVLWCQDGRVAPLEGGAA